MKQLNALKKNVDLWLKDHGIKAFFSASYDKNFADGAISAMNLVGLGKLTPNMVLMGFKSDWQTDPEGVKDYISVIHHGFDIHLAMGILRLTNGCDFSNVIGREEQIIINDQSGKSKAGDENSNDGRFAIASSLKLLTTTLHSRSRRRKNIQLGGGENCRKEDVRGHLPWCGRQSVVQERRR